MPSNKTSPAQSKLITFALIAACITALLFALNIFLGPKYGGDVEWYITAAEGGWDKLIEPYSARFLHPFLVATLSKILPLDIYQSFSVIAVASVFLFFLMNIAMLKDILKGPLLFIPLFFIPYFFDTLRLTFHPDAFYLMLTAFFFLLMYWKKESLGLLVFFFLFLTRESTILLGFIIFAVSWFFSKKALATTTIVVMLIALFTISVMRDIGEPNKHNLNSTAYVGAKFSYNFMRNVLGLNAWTNTYQNCEPIFKVHVPPFQSFGNIKEVGLCGFDARVPMQTVTTLLTVFGIAPLVLLYICMKQKNILKGLPFWMLLALIYGVVHFIFGVMAGTGVQRLVGYGWPAFLLVTPFLLKIFFKLDKKFLLKLSLTHLVVAWLPLVMQRVASSAIFEAAFVTFVVLAMYIYAFRLIKKQEMRQELDPVRNL